ncbi:MAG: hypothetical protein NTX15_01550 [Candidatus Kapabacteria bacterium]|nr:hypothetical protein [Candidatus Kapabacteria bacterium]
MIVGVNPFMCARPVRRVRISREYLSIDELLTHSLVRAPNRSPYQRFARTHMDGFSFRELLPDRDNANPRDKVFDFPSRDDVYNRRLEWWVAKAGIEKHITSHIAWHTFSTLLITQGN